MIGKQGDILMSNEITIKLLSAEFFSLCQIFIPICDLLTSDKEVHVYIIVSVHLLDSLQNNSKRCGWILIKFSVTGNNGTRNK